MLKDFVRFKEPYTGAEGVLQVDQALVLRTL